MNTNEAYTRLRQVEKAIRSSLADGKFLVAPQDIEMEDEKDPDERQLHDELHTALYHLDNVCSILSYYDRPSWPKECSARTPADDVNWMVTS